MSHDADAYKELKRAIEKVHSKLHDVLAKKYQTGDLPLSTTFDDKNQTIKINLGTKAMSGMLDRTKLGQYVRIAQKAFDRGAFHLKQYEGVHMSWLSTNVNGNDIIMIKVWE